jgi:hypothetical protein
MIYLLDTNAVIKMLYGNHISYVLKVFYAQKIQLAYHSNILSEYVEVTDRLRECVPSDRAEAFFVLLQENGFEVTKLGISPKLHDRDDEIFVRVLNSTQTSDLEMILVTDNQKDFLNAKGIKMILFQEFTDIVRKLK